MTARIQTLEQTIATQRASDAAATQKTEQFTLMLAGVFGLIVVAVVLLMAYLQWRAVARLVELAAPRPSAFARAMARTLPALAKAPPWSSRTHGCSARWTICKSGFLELEQMARAPLAEKNPPAHGKISKTALQLQTTAKSASQICSRKGKS